MVHFILLIGILIFSFYQYNKGPVYFDTATLQLAKQTVKKDSLNLLEAQYNAAFASGDKVKANEIRRNKSEAWS